ncbi:MAG TPA: TIGR01777 family oxidoreductase [Longimicrobium sp.]|nr:TIGR01777 family oxidoreductase [Longimicrobium sp.]
MRVAITGANGLIGKALAERLSSQGHSLRLLFRRPEEQRGLPPGAEAAFFDAYAQVPDGLLAGCDAVVNLAGENLAARWTKERKQRVLRSRVEGTAKIVKAARDAKVPTLVNASAVGYYGARGAEVLDEDAPPGDDYMAQVCRAWEEAAAPARQAGIRTVLCRIGVVLSPEGGALKTMLPAFRLGVGGRIGSGEQYVSWIHLEDMVSLLVHALTRPDLDGPLNGTAPEPVNNRELTRAIARAVHRPAIVPTPAFALKLALGPMSAIVLTGQRVMPRKALQSGFTFAHPTLPEALAHLLARRAA